MTWLWAAIALIGWTGFIFAWGGGWEWRKRAIGLEALVRQQLRDIDALHGINIELINEAAKEDA